MFTGLVRELGHVEGVDGSEQGVRLTVRAPTLADRVVLGASVALDGCCLTVTTIDDERLGFDAVPETLRRTTLGRLRQGSAVNLEPALRVGEALGGHYVQGHVDGVGRIRSSEREGEGLRVWVDAPAEVLRLCVEKGSITVAGVSLTVAELDDAGFAVALVPHTLAETTLGTLGAGDEVNLEPDVLAKYVQRLLAHGV